MIIKKKAVYYGLILKRVLFDPEEYRTICQQIDCKRGTTFSTDNDTKCYSEKDSICRKCHNLRKVLNMDCYKKHYMFAYDNKEESYNIGFGV